jgi:flagellar hook-associated protein 1 FlgK
MSGLIGGIYNQAQALAAQSTGLEIAGKNLANVNNPAYARQRVNIVTTDTGNASVRNISSTRDALIDKQIMLELMSQGFQDSQQQIISTLQSILGEKIDTAADQANSTGSGTSSNAGLYSILDNFFNAASTLASNPTEQANKQQLISAAQNLVDQLNYLSKSLTTQDTNVSAQITSKTADAQTLLSDIANLNSQIAKLEVANPGSALDLRDQRQADIEALSKLMNFTVQNSSKGLGQITITAPDATGNPITLVDGPITYGTLTYTGTGFTGGAAATSLAINTGSLAGYQTTRTQDIAGLQTGLNNIARQLVSSVNTAYNGNFFTAANTTAANISLDSTLTVTNLKTGSTADPGANDISKAISDLGKNSFSGGGAFITGKFGDYYNSQVSTIGQRISSLNSQQEGTSLVINSLNSQRAAASGVSTDEEATNIIVFQRAYQANAQVINAMDTLLQLVVTSLGRF